MAPSSKLIFLFLFSSVTGLSFTFNFTESKQSHECTPNQNTQCIKYQSDAFFSKGIQITKDQFGESITGSVGRAVYADKVLIWDSKTGEMTDFTTRFTFQINSFNESVYGDGLAFFLSPDPSIIPFSSAGGFLGLVNTTTKSINVTANSIVAVEFDSFKNDWDPSDDHVGINVNSIQSVESIKWNSSIKNGRPANAWISYNASSMNLSVFLTYEKDPVFDGNSSLSYKVDLRKFLPENGQNPTGSNISNELRENLQSTDLPEEAPNTFIKIAIEEKMINGFGSPFYESECVLDFEKDLVFGGNSSLSYKVDLRKFLPENVVIGFSAVTESQLASKMIVFAGYNFRLHSRAPNQQEANVSDSVLNSPGFSHSVTV
ncbi:seed lectin-like [Dioscorea cayenensis subsp. rotundata]|uniref:Seed lectin-like n=1 Tax=Dioscorea cayennensis subsp. rotundata TaxID=55577 RepID=A0AB40CNK1_DIOCR|nr:seed lectin-like [Dioscorea cayenensis subsp. rotundata]